jgi:hypothetical protein
MRKEEKGGKKGGKEEKGIGGKKGDFNDNEAFTGM